MLTKVSTNGSCFLISSLAAKLISLYLLLSNLEVPHNLLFCTLELSQGIIKSHHLFLKDFNSFVLLFWRMRSGEHQEDVLQLQQKLKGAESNAPSNFSNLMWMGCCGYHFNSYLWHLLSDFGQVLAFLANDETMKPRGGRDGGDCETVGLEKTLLT